MAIALTATGDTYLREASPLLGAGTDNFLVFGYNIDNTLLNTAIRFDISSILSYEITSASLDLRVTSAPSLTGLTVTIYGLTEGAGAEFDEDTSGANTEANWTNFATGQAWGTPGGAVDGVLGHLDFDATGFAAGDIALNVTDLVLAAQAEGYTTLGLIFALSGVGGGIGKNIIMASLQNSTVADRPVLNVEIEFVPGASTGRWTNFEGIARSLQH